MVKETMEGVGPESEQALGVFLVGEEERAPKRRQMERRTWSNCSSLKSFSFSSSSISSEVVPTTTTPIRMFCASVPGGNGGSR